MKKGVGVGGWQVTCKERQAVESAVFRMIAGLTCPKRKEMREMKAAHRGFMSYFFSVSLI